MSLLAFVSALCLGAASILGALALSRARPAWERASRLMASFGAVAILPALLDPATRAQAVFVSGVGLFSPRPLPELLAALFSFLIGVHATPSGGFSRILAAVTAVLASRALSSSIRERLGNTYAPAAAAALISSAAILLWDHGRVLRWRLDLVPHLGTGALELLLGLTLLLILGGGLLLLAALLTRGDRNLSFVIGRRAVILGAGLALLGAGLASLLVPTRRPELLPEAGRALALLWGVAGALVLGTILALGEEQHSDRVPARDASVAVLLATLTLASAGLEAWVRGGTSLGGDVTRVLPAVLFGLASRDGRGLVAKRALFLLSLLGPLV